jgi:hypothetical protein
MATTDALPEKYTIYISFEDYVLLPNFIASTLMIKKLMIEQEETAAEYTTSSIARAARLRREAKTGSLRQASKRRTFTRGRRKNTAVGGIHLRGDKRTLR